MRRQPDLETGELGNQSNPHHETPIKTLDTKVQVSFMADNTLSHMDARRRMHPEDKKSFVFGTFPLCPLANFDL